MPTLKPIRLKSTTPEARAFEFAVKTGRVTLDDFPKSNVLMRLLIRAIRADERKPNTG